LKKQGRIELPTLNGNQVKIRSVSPLAQSQANADITAIARWLELIQTQFGPQVTNLLINAEETAAHLAKKYGVPDSLIRDPDERRQIIEAAQQMAQMQQQMPQQPQQGMTNEQAN
jgi:glutathione S-transferase